MLPLALSSDLLRLDLPAPADAARVFEYCQDASFERYLTLPWPYTFAHAEGFLTDYVPGGWASDRECTWALRAPEGSGDDLCGVIGLRLLGPTLDASGHPVRRASVGFWVGTPFRGRSLIGEAQRLVYDWAFATGLVDVIDWECVTGNTASARAARKSGFTFTGTRPAVATYRDGSHPLSWTARLRATDDRTPQPGWEVLGL